MPIAQPISRMPVDLYFCGNNQIATLFDFDFRERQRVWRNVGQDLVRAYTLVNSIETNHYASNMYP